MIEFTITGEARQVMFTDGTELRVFDYGSNEYTDVIEHEGRIDALDYLGNTSKELDNFVTLLVNAPIWTQRLVFIQRGMKLV